MEMSRSSYARALRLQGAESQMQLAALYGPLGVSISEPALVEQVVARLEVTKEAEVSVEPETNPNPNPNPNQSTEPTVVDIGPAEVVAIAPLEETVSEEPPIEVVAEIGPEDEIEQVMYQWASAWAGQDVEAYLDVYSNNFVPTGQQSLAQWQAQRRQRLARPDRIELELEEMEVLIFDVRHARVRLTQGYRSERYSDVTRKEFQMVREDGHWRISSERTLEVISR